MAVDSAMLKVFISYSRRDQAFADDLVCGLRACGLEPYLDKLDIAPGEAWEQRLGGLILQADSVVFVLSPDFLSSTHCTWESDEAQRLAKRLVPVIWRPVEGAAVPAPLRPLNYIFFSGESSFAKGLEDLARALKEDLGWLREHTRLGEAAARWTARGEPEELLLRAGELASAKEWLRAKPRTAPEPTDMHRRFIAESEAMEVRQASAERRQLELMTTAQAEKEAALLAAACKEPRLFPSQCFVFKSSAYQLTHPPTATQVRPSRVIHRTNRRGSVRGWVHAPNAARRDASPGRRASRRSR